jgi:hypothetical protein
MKIHALLVGAALLLGGCTAAVQHTPVSLIPSATAAAPVVLARSVVVTFDSGYARPINAGSRWTLAGTVAQGTVYRPVGDVFTVEGAHIHEAWLVLDRDQLVGFYLPAERGFSSLRTPLTLHLQNQGLP